MEHTWYPYRSTIWLAMTTASVMGAGASPALAAAGDDAGDRQQTGMAEAAQRGMPLARAVS